MVLVLVDMRDFIFLNYRQERLIVTSAGEVTGMQSADSLSPPLSPLSLPTPSCVCVCVRARVQNIWKKTYERILMNFLEVERGPGRNRLDFGLDSWWRSDDPPQLGLPDFQSRNTGDFYRAMHVVQRAVLLW